MRTAVMIRSPRKPTMFFWFPLFGRVRAARAQGRLRLDTCLSFGADPRPFRGSAYFPLFTRYTLLLTHLPDVTLVTRCLLFPSPRALPVASRPSISPVVSGPGLAIFRKLRHLLFQPRSPLIFPSARCATRTALNARHALTDKGSTPLTPRSSHPSTWPNI